MVYINGREVQVGKLFASGVDSYFVDASFVDNGDELNDSELEQLNEYAQEQCAELKGYWES